MRFKKGGILFTSNKRSLQQMDEKKLKKIIEEEIANIQELEFLKKLGRAITGAPDPKATFARMVPSTEATVNGVYQSLFQQANSGIKPGSLAPGLKSAVQNIKNLAEAAAEMIHTHGLIDYKELVRAAPKVTDIKSPRISFRPISVSLLIGEILRNPKKFYDHINKREKPPLQDLIEPFAKQIATYDRVLQRQFKQILAYDARKSAAASEEEAARRHGDTPGWKASRQADRALGAGKPRRIRESNINDIIHEEVDSVLNEFVGGLIDKAKSALGMGGDDKPAEPQFAKNYREAIALAEDIGEMDPNSRGKGFGTIHLAFRRGTAKGDWASEGMLALEKKAAQLRGILDGIIQSKKSFIEEAYKKGMDRVAVNQAVEDMHPPRNSELAANFAKVEKALGAYERNLRPYVQQALAQHNKEQAAGYEGELKRKRDAKFRAIKYENKLAYARLLRLAAASGGRMTASSARLEEGGPFKLGSDAIRYTAKSLAKNDGDTDVNILRATSREEIEAALSDLLAKREITAREAQAAIFKLGLKEAGSYTKSGRPTDRGYDEFDHHGKPIQQSGKGGSTPWKQQPAVNARYKQNLDANIAIGRRNFKAAAKAEREAEKKAKRKKRK